MARFVGSEDPERTAKLGIPTVYLPYRFVILTPAEIAVLNNNPNIFLIYTGEDEDGEHKVDFIDNYDNILFTYFDTQIIQGTDILCVECGRTNGKRQRRWHVNRWHESRAETQVFIYLMSFIRWAPHVPRYTSWLPTHQKLQRL
jgi:hypothetical protein